MNDKEVCKIDLNRVDIYEELVIPDQDVEIALKVLRTIQSVLDGENLELLSKTHEFIIDCVEKLQTDEIGEQ